MTLKEACTTMDILKNVSPATMAALVSCVWRCLII